METQTQNTKTSEEVRIGYQPGESSDNNVLRILERHLQNYPLRPALRWVPREESEAFNGDTGKAFSSGEVNFAELYTATGRLAHGFKQMGIEKGDRVILFLPMGLGMYAAMFALQRIGAIAVFLDSWARRSHLGACAECVQPKAMISFAQAFVLIGDIPEFAGMPLRIIAGPGNDGSYSAQLEELFQLTEEAPVEPVESEHTALITFTTGSSGTPKGANRTHRFLCAQHEALREVIPYEPEDVDIPAFPIFSLNNLASGVTTLIPAINLAEPKETDSAALVTQIVHGEVSCTTLSPSMLNNLSKYCSQNGVVLSSLRRVVTGGAPISKDNVRDFKEIAPNAEIWILYGSTEVEPMAHIEAEEMLADRENPDPEVIEEGVNVGIVDGGLQYKFIRPTTENIDFAQTKWQDLEVAEGSVGEFIVSGEHVCESYYNNEAAFFKSKIKDDEGRIWHRTGDLARIDGDRRLWIVGRIHNMIERSREYYFPVSAEIILKRCDFIKRGAFVGIDDEDKGQRTAVVVELSDNMELDKKEAIAEVLRLFGKNEIPVDSFYVVDSIPMDPRHHSKVEYSVLREQLVADGVEDLL